MAKSRIQVIDRGENWVFSKLRERSTVVKVFFLYFQWEIPQKGSRKNLRQCIPLNLDDKFVDAEMIGMQSS